MPGRLKRDAKRPPLGGRLFWTVVFSKLPLPKIFTAQSALAWQ